MRIPEIQKNVEHCMKANIPVLMLGAPGVGKSQAIRQVAEKQGRELIDLRLPLLNPVDLRGIPVVKEDKSHWMSPAFLPSDPNSNAIILLDEITSAPPSVQVAGYQLVLDRKVGEYELPKKCSILAAGNRTDDRAVVYEMSSALRNRFLHLEVDVNLEDWKDWAVSRRVDSSIISFLNFKEDQLFAFDPKVHKQNFPTPRSWEFVDRLVKQMGTDEAVANRDLISGLIGQGAATEFAAFVQIMHKLPDPAEVVIKRNMKTKCPSDPSSRYAFSGALNSCALHAKDFVQATLNLSKYCEVAFPVEFAVLTLKDLARTVEFKKNFQKIIASQEWRDLAKKHGSLVLD